MACFCELLCVCYSVVSVFSVFRVSVCSRTFVEPLCVSASSCASAQVRQSKEQLGKARIDVDVAREQVRAAIASSFANYHAARASVSANTTSVNANKQALNGLIQERDVGQRTTLDVLNGQASVITAQVALVQAEGSLVSASYGVAASTGKLSPRSLGLGVKEYDVKKHFKAVEDKWFGLRTPTGQ